ncbi:non-ribosomal peptide synthetase [Desulfovibrio sp.]|uniref:non-ribosomal peptide synthetase n=1 Tax=Desulfovibrio sp. TaxID=885 RepID=UPI0025B86E81|nr:non-ribosomal peptide synthetase [Desulfovibrio sp.]
MMKLHEERVDAIAVIGASGRFPKAGTLEDFWAALRDGKNCTDTVSLEALKSSGVTDAELDAEGYVTAMGRLDGVMEFDAGFFGLSAHDAALIDPQQRKFIECSYEALEEAGYAFDSPDRRIGVYASASHSSYLPSAILGAGTARVTEALQMAIGNDRDYLATRISNLLNLTGPSLTVQTACSSSLTAIHLACQSLLAGECDMALAGGVSITLPQTDGYHYREGLILSRSGVCRPFDALADGTVNGNGVGVILLKPLDAALRDGDLVRAIIRGTAVNNDGSNKAGYTAPSVLGEAAIISEALAVSGVGAEEVGFISTHGTATAIGDPIEVEALVRAFNTAQTESCTLGAVKANIGHLDAAAGVAGFLEAMLALEHRELPPIAGFNTPNPGLRLHETPFVIRKKAVMWDADKRFAMANAFGFGGTNVSVILEEAPKRENPGVNAEAGPFILPLSASTPEALRALMHAWQASLQNCENVADACWAAACRRNHFACRAAVVGQGREDLLDALKEKLSAEGTDGADHAEKPYLQSPDFPAAELLRCLCASFEKIRITVEQQAVSASLSVETALAQQRFCSDMLADICRDTGIDANGLQFVPGGNEQENSVRFLREVAEAYEAGESVHWEFLLAKIPLTPFSRIEHCHALAHRREWVPSDPASSAQAAAARMAVSAEYILEPELLAQREALLEDLCAAGVARAFARLGFPARTTVAGALEAMRIPPQFSQLAERLVEALHERGMLQGEGDCYLNLEEISDERFDALKEATQSVWDAWGAMKQVVISTVDHLPELLQGRLDLRETFMPKGDLSGARRVYSELPNSTYFNSLVREHVRQWLACAASGEAVRIFEIGGGTAATTERVLPLLPPDRASYTFTDVSPVFLRQAQERFAEYGFLRTGIFNMEESPEKQGFEAGIHDIVIAANVLHAAEDLTLAVRHASSLLRPGGLLLLYEITRANFLGEITTGLLLPNISDRDVRGIQPMASNDLWEDILAASGFENVRILPQEGQASAVLPDRVISARLRPQADHMDVALPRNCTYQTVWEPKKVMGGSVPLGLILLLADSVNAPLFETAAQHRGLLVRHVPEHLTAADLQEWTRGHSVCTVLDARAISEIEPSHDCIEQERLCGGLLKLLAEFTSADCPGVEWNWISLTWGAAAKVLHPQQAAFWGMNRVVEMGHPEFHLKQFDLADKTAHAVETVFDVLQSGSSEELNAIADDQWLVPRLERCAVSDFSLNNASPDKTGWQVIVGGLGGLTLAEYLAAKGFRKIVLVSRHAPDAVTAGLLSGLGKQECTVVAVQADVTDYAALDRAVASLEESAPVRGIYHCAVVKRVNDADERAPWDAFRQILAPKVQGAWNLHRLSIDRRMHLDHMVLFSSSVSVVPAYSLPHYVAANTYLDALAVWRKGQGLPALSISWGAWKDVGTVSDPAQADHLRNGGLHSLAPSEALALLAAAQEREVAHLAVMKVDWTRLMRQFGHRAPAYFKKVAGNAHAKAESRVPSSTKPVQDTASARQDILTCLRGTSEESKRRALLEKWLTGRFAALLKIAPEAVDHTVSLFDLGVDSLMFIEMSDGLEKALDIKISPSSLLQDFCIEKMAAKLLPDLKLETAKASALADLLIPEPEKKYEPFRLTDVQRAYWVGRRQEMALGNTACQGYIEFDCEALDVLRLEDSWQRLIDRHDTLRTIIEEEGLQRVLEKTPPFRITVHDLENRPGAEQQEALQAVRDRLSHKVHDPAVWPLFDVEVSLLSDGVRRLHVLMDNVVMDGRSISILLAQWASLYHNPELSLPAETVSFRDYVSPVDRCRAPEAFHEAETYWKEEARHLPPAPALPLAKDPASISKPRFVRHDYRMNPDVWEALKAAAGRHGVTFSSVLLAAYAEILGLWSRSPDLTVNAPVFTRLPVHPDINNVVGEFTSSVLVRCETGRSKSFADKVKAVQQRTFDGLKFCQMSGVEVMRRKIRDGASAESVRMPVVFTSTFGLAKMADTGFASSIAGFSSLGREIYNISQTPQVWIDNHVHDRDGTLSIYWDTVEELFPEGMVGSMFGAYCRLLERLAEDAASWGDFSPASQVSEEEISVQTTAAAGLLHAGFLRNLVEQPDRLAVVDGERSLTYAELFSVAAGLAHRLGKVLAAAGEDTPLVAVALPKGWRQAVAVLGVLFAGAAYVPIDPNWPLLRRRAVLEEARPVCLVALSTENPETWNGMPIFAVDEAAPQAAAPDTFLQASSDSLAYVIFTSGTTGTPKGVMMSHAGAMTTIAEINRRFAVTWADRVLALSSLTFDLSVYDFFGIWAAGGAVVIPGEDEVRTPGVWRRLMEEHAMFWQMLLESGEIPDRSPRLVLLSGDRIPLSLPGKSAELFPHARMVSLGGATEAGIWSICHEMLPDDPQPGWQSVPYGKALAGQSFHVLHDDLRFCPQGVAGELYIGGAALALGYLHNKEKTEESFILHPVTQKRLYRTGDLGVRHADGEIEFLGRTDSQVKVGGFRIELGDVEAALAAMPEVSHCAVVLTKSRQLAAFVVPADGSRSPSEAAARLFLEERLPRYMVPASVNVIERMPLTPNGKVDRSKLIDICAGDRRTASDEARSGSSPSEAMLCDIWGEVLEVAVAASDNVFALGADSLAAVRAETLLKRRYGIKLSIQTVFDQPVVREMAKSLDAHVQSDVSTLRDSGSSDVLFCLGDAVTDGSSFHDFARYWPLGHVKTVSVLPKDKDTLETVIERISRHISLTQPQGPLRLAGYCAGGLLVWLAAEHLRKLGRVVDRLILIDCMPLPPGIHNAPESLEGIVMGMAGHSSPELLENLGSLCAILESAEYRNTDVPFTFVESKEIVGQGMGFEFWRSRASCAHKISSPGNHANCLKRKQLLEWIGRLIDWYETDGGEQHA